VPSAGQVRQPNGKFSKPDGNDEIDEVVLREVIAAAGALSTPPEPAQMAQAAATARDEYAPPSDGAGAVADVTALVAQSMAKAGMNIPGGPAALEAFLLQQPAPAADLMGDTNLRQMLPREVIAQKTEIARQAFELVSEQLARGGGKRANTARKLREQPLVTITVPVSRSFCFNGLFVDLPAGTYNVPFDIAGHYTRSVLLAAQTEREDLAMRWTAIINPSDPMQRLRKIEPTQFRIS
jgi:hypothetical protein